MIGIELCCVHFIILDLFENFYVKHCIMAERVTLNKITIDLIKDASKY